MIPRECEKCIHCRVCAYNNPKRKQHCGFYEESRPTGKWIGNELGQCSICGHKGCASDIWNGCNDKTYCPNCGALLE